MRRAGDFRPCQKLRVGTAETSRALLFTCGPAPQLYHMRDTLAKLESSIPLRHRARIDRFKLASRSHVRERLMNDEIIAEGVRVHAQETGTPIHEAWKRVDEY